MSDAIRICEVSSEGDFGRETDRLEFLLEMCATKSQRASSTRPRERILVVDDERIIAAVRPVSGCFGIDSNWRGFSRKSLCSRGGDQ